MVIVPFIDKWVYPQDSFENDLDFMINSESPLTVDLSEEDPAVRFNIEIVNKLEYLDAQFDRAIFSIVLNAHGHVTVVHQAYLLKKDIIRRKQSLSFYIVYPLNPIERQTARRAIQDALHCEATIRIEYYIESKRYRFWKQQERRTPAKVVNNPLPAV